MIGVMLCISSEPVERMLGVLECGDKAKRRHRFRKGAKAGRWRENRSALHPSKMPT
jgi:hypothetical protein